MPRIFCVIFLFFYTLPSFSQTSVKENNYKRMPVSVIYGSKFFQDNFNGRLNSLNNPRFNGAVSMAGVCVNEYYSLNPWIKSENVLYYAQVLPAGIRINDSITANVSGFQFGASFFGKSFIAKNNRNNRISLLLGFNTGRLKIKGSEGFGRKNAFFSPKLTLKPTVKIWHLYLSLIVEYEYDVSKKLWKDTRSASSPVPVKNLSQTGYSAFISLDFELKTKTELEKNREKNRKAASKQGKRSNRKKR